MSPLEFQNLYSPISGRAAGNGSAGGRGTAGLGGLERRSESNEEAADIFLVDSRLFGPKMSLAALVPLALRRLHEIGPSTLLGSRRGGI